MRLSLITDCTALLTFDLSTQPVSQAMENTGLFGRLSPGLRNRIYDFTLVDEPSLHQVID